MAENRFPLNLSSRSPPLKHSTTNRLLAALPVEGVLVVMVIEESKLNNLKWEQVVTGFFGSKSINWF